MGDAHTGFGGGAINEKLRQENGGAPELSHIMHASWGLDHYPNYLNRWHDNEIEKLELLLEKQLQLVRNQRQQNATLRKSASAHLTSSLKAPVEWAELDRILAPGVLQALSKPRQKASVADLLSGDVEVRLGHLELERLLEEEADRAYSLPVFTAEFCKILRSELKALLAQALVAGKPSDHLPSSLTAESAVSKISLFTLGHRPVDLDTVGLSWVNDLLFNVVVKPCARLLYESDTGGPLDWRQGYAVGYAPVPSADQGITRDHLIRHTDDSEITFNCCLGDDFTGGQLVLSGIRGDPDEGNEGLQYAPRQGRAIIHTGRHLHSVAPVTSGTRLALIMWTRSWQGVRARMCPCCWMNGRSEATAACVCGPVWN